MNCLTQKKKKVTGNSPGCFSIIDQESTQRASFPILEPKKLQPGASEYPVHGHIANEWLTQEERLSLQGQAGALNP